jgi:hypothetical protein
MPSRDEKSFISHKALLIKDLFVGEADVIFATHPGDVAK